MRVTWEAGCRFSLDLTDLAEYENYRLEESWVVTDLRSRFVAPPGRKISPLRGHFWWGR